MNADDAVVTQKARAVAAGHAGIPYLQCVITVEGEPERVQATRLILQTARRRSAPGGSWRYHLVYKAFSMEHLTSVNWTRRSWREGTQEPLMGASVIPLW